MRNYGVVIGWFPWFQNAALNLGLKAKKSKVVPLHAMEALGGEEV
jgi:hypothetical protein